MRAYVRLSPNLGVSMPWWLALPVYVVWLTVVLTWWIVWAIWVSVLLGVGLARRLWRDHGPTGPASGSRGPAPG